MTVQRGHDQNEENLFQRQAASWEPIGADVGLYVVSGFFVRLQRRIQPNRLDRRRWSWAGGGDRRQSSDGSFEQEEPASFQENYEVETPRTEDSEQQQPLSIGRGILGKASERTV